MNMFKYFKQTNIRILHCDLINCHPYLMYFIELFVYKLKQWKVKLVSINLTVNNIKFIMFNLSSMCLYYP